MANLASVWGTPGALVLVCGLFPEKKKKCLKSQDWRYGKDSGHNFYMRIQKVSSDFLIHVLEFK